MQWLAAKWLLITGELTVRASSTVADSAELVVLWSVCSVVKKSSVWYTLWGTGKTRNGTWRNQKKKIGNENGICAASSLKYTWAFSMVHQSWQVTCQ